MATACKLKWILQEISAAKVRMTELNIKFNHIAVLAQPDCKPAQDAHQVGHVKCSLMADNGDFVMPSHADCL